MFEPPSTKTFVIRIYIYIQGIGDIIRQTPQVGMKDAPDKTVCPSWGPPAAVNVPFWRPKIL
jgi:hypothetical protein